MKKSILGVLVLVTLFLGACGGSKDEVKKETTKQSSKIEALEKKIDVLESIADTETSETSTPVENVQQSKSNEEILNSLTFSGNKKITQTFLDADLPMYGYEYEGPGELPEIEADDMNGFPKSLTSLSFYVEPGTNGMIVTIKNFESMDDLNLALKWYSEEYAGYSIVTNQDIKAFIVALTDTPEKEETYKKYVEVFENIK